MKPLATFDSISDWCRAMLGIVPLLASVSLSPQPVAADETPTVVLRTFSVITSFRLPPWSDNPEVFEDSEVNRQQGLAPQGHQVFYWETIPKDESFDDWSEFYAISAEYPLAGDIDGYVNGLVNGFAEACSNVAILAPDSPPNQTRIFVIYCESYNNEPDTGGNCILCFQAAE